jgi:hypothetical protein
MSPQVDKQTKALHTAVQAAALRSTRRVKHLDPMFAAGLALGLLAGLGCIALGLAIGRQTPPSNLSTQLSLDRPQTPL